LESYERTSRSLLAWVGTIGDVDDTRRRRSSVGRAAVDPRCSERVRRSAWRSWEFRILGPLEVLVGGRAVPLDAAKPRALLGILLALGEGDRARALTEERLAVARRTGDLTALTYAEFNAGVVLARCGELEEAERLIEESVRGARRLGNARSVGNWLRALGGIISARGELAKARSLFEESLSIHRALRDAWGTSQTLSRLALIMLGAEDHEEARRLLAESIQIEREAGGRSGLVLNVELCGRLEAAEGRPVDAVCMFGCASALRESVGAHPTEIGWPDHRRQIAGLCSSLGEDVFDESWKRGRATEPDDALDAVTTT
jgi:tetratricopeptide (TPR) repeat protein